MGRISSKSVHNFFRYPSEMQKSGVDPVPGSGLSTGSSSKSNQFVQAPMAMDPLNFIEIVYNFFRYPAEMQKSSVDPVPGSGL